MTDGIVFTRPEDAVPGVLCDICGEEMDVQRNVKGPTGMAEAMAKRSHLHDRFSCSFRDEMWHRQVCKLKEAAAKSPSKQIADIMTTEAEQVLKAREATKEVSKFF